MPLILHSKEAMNLKNTENYKNYRNSEISRITDGQTTYHIVISSSPLDKRLLSHRRHSICIFMNDFDLNFPEASS